MFSYIHQGSTHTNTERQFMSETLGMSAEQIDSVLQQKAYELSQNIQKRQEAYRAESDPLYMEWQYDQTAEAEQAWRNKVQEIKSRYPLS